MKKKIIYLTALDSVHSQKWIKFFLKKRDVIIITLDKIKNNNKIKGVKIFSFSKFRNKYVNLLFCLLFIMRNKKKLSNAIIHLHYIGILSFAAILLKNNNKLITTVWGSDININYANFFKRLIINKILLQSCKITTDSNKIKKFFSSRLAEIYKKIYIINFGIDVKKFKKIKSNSKMLKTNCIKICSLRNHFQVYNIETILKACKLLFHKKINFKCYIYGTGEMTVNYKSYIKKNKLEKNVIIKGSYLQKDLPKIISGCHFYISTSKSDGGLAASTAEAMACECTCIISKNSDNKIWIKSRKNGFLVNNFDYKKISNIIMYYNNKKKLLFKIGKNARKKIVDDNNYYIEMNKVNILYETI